VHKLVACAFIPNPDGKPIAGHRDGNKQNNIILNLRWSSRSESQWNRRKQRANASSVYKGVYWNSRANKWHSSIKVDCKPLFLGLFTSERAAARAYDLKCIELFGEFACPNNVGSDSDPEETTNTPDDDTNTDSQDDDSPELTPTSDYEEFNAESGDVEEDVD